MAGLAWPWNIRNGVTVWLMRHPRSGVFSLWDARSSTRRLSDWRLTGRLGCGSCAAMPAPQPDAYQRAAHRFATAGKLDAAAMMLNWDAQTHMPSGGAWARGEQMAALTEVSADLVGSRAAGDELAEAEAMASALAPEERADLFEMRRAWIHASAAPKELLAAKSRAAQNLQAVWTKAKPVNDFAAFAAGFSELLALTREIAQAKAEALGTTPYGALIDEFDPGVSEAVIDPIFADLAANLPGLL